MLYIGVDLGGTNIVAGLVNSQGELLDKATRPTRANRHYSEVIEDIAQCVEDVLRKTNTEKKDIVSLGIGIPGMAEKDTGLVVFCTNLGWTDVPLGEVLNTRLDLPIFVDNDANVAGYAESISGVSKGITDSVFITLGTGLGAGIVLDGKIRGGVHNIGAELGHMIIEVDGNQCNCGNKGCWERYASATAIIEMGKKAALANPSSLLMSMINDNVENMEAKTVFEAAKSGDKIAVDVFDRYVKYLCLGIVSIINFIDPEMIIIGGGISAAGSFLLDAVKANVPQYIMFKSRPYAKIELAQLGNDAGVIGSALLGTH